MRLAIGFSVHTGWAACVVAGGTLRTPRIVARERVDMLADPDRFVFHRAAELDLASAERAIADAERRAKVRAAEGLARLLEHGAVVCCAVVAKDPALPSLGEILAAHPRIHSAEGRFYRDVLEAAIRERGVTVRVLSPLRLEEVAAKAMKLGVGEIAPLLDAAGRVAGRPWAKDQKVAALAAWTVLAG